LLRIIKYLVIRRGPLNAMQYNKSMKSRAEGILTAVAIEIVRVLFKG